MSEAKIEPNGFYLDPKINYKTLIDENPLKVLDWPMLAPSLKVKLESEEN